MAEIVHLSTKRAEHAAKRCNIIPLDALACACGSEDRTWIIWNGGALQCTACHSFCKDMICVSYEGRIG